MDYVALYHRSKRIETTWRYVTDFDGDLFIAEIQCAICGEIGDGEWGHSESHSMISRFVAVTRGGTHHGC